MSNGNTVTVEVIGGPTITVVWSQGMNAQQALEEAYNQINNSGQFTYALQYYGSGLGYLVVMINETYDSFISSSAPFYYWEFFVNGISSLTGVDNTILNSGDAVSFELQMYAPETHPNSLLKAKHEFQLKAASKQ